MPYRSFGGRTSRGPRRAYHAAPTKRRSNRGNKEYIDPSRFIKTARKVEVEQYVPENMFADFDVHELLHENIVKKGFVAPSPIQDKAIPAGLTGQDVIGIANTCTSLLPTQKRRRSLWLRPANSHSRLRTNAA
jgi:hypothetical protein